MSGGRGAGPTAMKGTFTAASALALATLAAGCGGRQTTPAPVPVSGAVTFDGRPLEGADVIFYPEDSNHVGTPGRGRTGPGGRYKAWTRDRWGVVPGVY